MLISVSFYLKHVLPSCLYPEMFLTLCQGCVFYLLYLNQRHIPYLYLPIAAYRTQFLFRE